MLQSVHGTKQYWFARQGELERMIRECGLPTLFLTFSCAEYESPNITNYLRKVNNVPTSYNIGKLCTEDPISVSRKFSLKFHAFFHQMIFKVGSSAQLTTFIGKRNTNQVVHHTTMFCFGYVMHHLLVVMILTRCWAGFRNG